MGFDLHLTIPEDSAAARAVRQVAEAEHISNDEAAIQLLARGAKSFEHKTPAELMWGAFPDHEDESILDEIVAEAYALRQSDQIRNLDC